MTQHHFAAYERAIYQAFPQGQCLEIRFAQHHPALDRLLDDNHAHSWALMTAFNPRSIRLSAYANALRQRQLEQMCCNRGCAVMVARGGSDAWGWETSCLAVRVTRPQAMQFGRLFAQNAVLFGEKGRRAELLDCTVSPRAAMAGRIR